MNPIAVRNLTARYGRTTALADVSLEVAAGSVYVLLGPAGAGKSTFVRCLLGRQKPTAGTCLLFGEPARRSRAWATGRVALVSGESGARRTGPAAELSEALAAGPELLVLDDPTLGPAPSARRFLLADLGREAARRGTTLFLAARDVIGVEGVATRVGLLRKGRLLVDDAPPRLEDRFRRIRYTNELTEGRTEFGTELDAFDAVRVKVRGWGIEAVVSDFDEQKFARFRSIEGVVDAEAEPLSLEEILEALVDTASPGDTRGPTP